MHVLNQIPKYIQDYLSFEKKPINILSYDKKQLRNKEILLVRVLWKDVCLQKKTWEHEHIM